MKYILILLVLVVTGCGFSSRENEVVGQVKRVVKRTPLICNDRTDVDMSMGVMRNGTGSMSKEDIWLTVADPNVEKALKGFAESGVPVKITYDVQRVTFCWEDHILRSVQESK